MWKHRFVCLAYCDQNKIPTTDMEKNDLLQAGLGEKEVEFASLDLDADEFCTGHIHNWRMQGDFSSSSVSRIVDDWSHSPV